MFECGGDSITIFYCSHEFIITRKAVLRNLFHFFFSCSFDSADCSNVRGVWTITNRGDSGV